MAVALPIDYEAIAAFCEKHHILCLSLFGSVLREDFTDESDVDFLVEFDPEHIPGFFRLADMEIELSEIIGRKADLRTAKGLSRYFRDEVVAAAQPVYVSSQT